MNATIAFHFLCTIAIKALTLEEISEKPTDLRLIGPGSGFLLRLLEKLFGKLKTFQKHAVLQDVFGNFYADFEEGPGYWYASATWLLSFMRNGPNLWVSFVLKNWPFVWMMRKGLLKLYRNSTWRRIKVLLCADSIAVIFCGRSSVIYKSDRE